MKHKITDDHNHRATDLKRLALALGIGLGMAAGSGQAQTVIEVGGAGLIGDEVLTTTTVPANGAKWKASGGDGGIKYSYLDSPTAVVANAGPVTLTFTHRYDFEVDYDGGAVYVNVNGGGFVKVPLASFTSNGYNAAINGNTAWPTGEEVFSATSTDYGVPTLITSVANLGSLNATDSVVVQFRGGWDDNTNGANPNWEIGTVTISDTGTTLLDADFTPDGPSGFTASTTGTPSSPWTYLKATNRFEINATTVTADRYKPVTVGSAIDLNGANIQVVKLTGTLAAGQVYTLFDLSGGTTLTGSLGTLSLPGGEWDTSSLATAGTITCLDPAAPVIYEPFADLNPSLNGNTPGLGLSGTWSAGSNVAGSSLTYGGLAFKGGRAVVNPGGGNYQENGINPGTTLTGAGLMTDGATLWFSALIVNHTSSLTSDERTYLALGTGNADGFDRIGGNGGSGFTVAVSKNAEGAVTAQGWGNGSAGAGGAFRGANVAVAQDVAFLAVGKITWGPFGTANSDVFELYLPGPDLVLPATPASKVMGNFDQLGTANVANAFDTISFTGGHKISLVPEVDEIRFGATYADVTPRDVIAPKIVSTNPVDDSPSGSATQQVATFDKLILAGTGDIRIVNDTDTVTTTIPVGDSQIVVSGKTLTITPTVPLLGGKAYHIEIDAGAVTNLNLIDFGGISSATEWNFATDNGPPTVVSIDDDTSPLPILINSSLTYTVTFSEAINAGTVDTTDFANDGSAPITVDSVSTTGDPAVFKVVVSTLGTFGDLTLKIVTGAVITDSNGNPLDTTSAIVDLTTIAVNDPVPTAASLVTAFQGIIASQTNAAASSEARFFNVSVNPANAGTGWYCANDTSGTPVAAGVRKFTGPVVAYKFLGNTENSVSGTAGSGGEDTRIAYATTDPLFDGFGQQQMRLWTTNNPGADLATGAGAAATGFAGIGNYGYRDWTGATGTIGISGLASGSVHIYYGSYSSKPSLKVTMRDTDNVAADIVIANAHLNGDSANDCEYYLAEIDFVTDGFYDVIEYEWTSPNGRGLGTVLTGPDVAATPYTLWASTNAPTTGNDPSADEDKDGVSNGVEFVLGGTIATNDLGKLPKATTSGANLTFSFVRDQDSIDASVAVSIEVGTDLATWPTAYPVPDTATAGPPVAVVDNADGTDTVTLTVAQEPDAKKFARLKVVIAP